VSVPVPVVTVDSFTLFENSIFDGYLCAPSFPG
jgi:hypothetical protein